MAATFTTGVYPAVFTSIVRPPLAQGKPEPSRPYAKLPHDLAADPRLLPIDVRLLLALVFFARDKDHCWPSDATLGGRIARARATVQRRLKHLEGLGLIGREKTDANPTGRLLRLRWRIRETPPVSRTTAAPLPPVRHELEKQKERLFASPSRGERRGLPAQQAPMTPDEIRAWYAEIGWLDRPEGDPLRRLAEKRLSEALRGPSVSPMQDESPPSRSPYGRQRRGHGGPRPLFGG